MSKQETICIHAGQRVDPVDGSRALPLHQTSCYVFKSAEEAADRFALKSFGPIYTRLNNPTVAAFEERVAALDGGTAAVATSSGMSAVFLAVTNLCGCGDHIVSSASLYGGTSTLFNFTLPRLGIKTTFLDDINAEKVAAAITPETKLVYLETIGNPKGDIPDIESIAKAAHAHNVPLIIDNTFGTGVCRPLDFGADIVIYSATKWMQGHGTAIAGVIIDGGKFNWRSGRFPEFTQPDESYHGLVYCDAFENVPGMGNIAFAIKARVQGLRNIGMCLSPFNAREMLIGMETLPLRMARHGENTRKLVDFLSKDSRVAWINFTGLDNHPSHANALKYLQKDFFGAVFGFGVKGGEAAARAFIGKVKLASHVANVGDAKTLVIHPWSTTHQQLSDEAKKACGISDDFIRVSVGLENCDDIIADFDQALN